MKTIFPQRIEIDLTGTGLVRVYHDIEVDVGGQKVQVMKEVRGSDGKITKQQPYAEFEACDCLAGLIEKIADSVKTGEPFQFPEDFEAVRLAGEEVRKRRPIKAESPPAPTPEPIKTKIPASMQEAPAATDLYPETGNG